MRSLALRALVAAGLCLALSAPGFAAHPHYERLMRRGILALEQGDPPRAKRDLRLACFGMLEMPEELVECLVHLGLAQSADGDGEGFRATFDKILEAEERFGAYSAAPLPAGLRTTFESAVVRLVPTATTEMVAAFRDLASRVGASEGGGATAPRGAAPPATAVAESRPPPRPAPAPDPSPPTPPPVPTPAEGETPAPTESAPPPPAAPPAGALPADERAKLERARSLLAAATRRVDVEEPYRLAHEVADARPESAEAQHLAAVIAYRASRWAEAITYFRRGGDPGDDQPERLFYLAVALYESGEQEAAAEVFRRSLPQLEPTPFVRSYQEKILGGRAEP